MTYSGVLKSTAKPGRLHNKAQRHVGFTASAVLHSVYAGERANGAGLEGRASLRARLKLAECFITSMHF